MQFILLALLSSAVLARESAVASKVTWTEQKGWCVNEVARENVFNHHDRQSCLDGCAKTLSYFNDKPDACEYSASKKTCVALWGYNDKNWGNVNGDAKKPPVKGSGIAVNYMCNVRNAEEGVGGFGGECKQEDLDAGCTTVMKPFGPMMVPTCQCSEEAVADAEFCAKVESYCKGRYSGRKLWGCIENSRCPIPSGTGCQDPYVKALWGEIQVNVKAGYCQNPGAQGWKCAEKDMHGCAHVSAYDDIAYYCCAHCKAQMSTCNFGSSETVFMKQAAAFTAEDFAVYGFAVLGFGFLAYGAGKHFFASKKDSATYVQVV